MTIKVGIAVSLTGQFRLQGKQTLAGIRAWVDDCNAAGGMRVAQSDRPVELVWRDDGSRRDAALGITEQLIVADRVDILIGPYSAVLTNAAAEVARVRGKLLWNQGGASPLVYQQGNPVGCGSSYLRRRIPGWPAPRGERSVSGGKHRGHRASS